MDQGINGCSKGRCCINRKNGSLSVSITGGDDWEALGDLMSRS